MDLKAMAMGLAFALMWSSAFTSARIIVTETSPLAASALRFLLAGLVAVAIARAQGQSWRLTRAQACGTVIFGLCQNALYLGLFFMAMQRIEASLASILASSMPLVVALAAWTVFGDRPKPLALAGQRWLYQRQARCFWNVLLTPPKKAICPWRLWWAFWLRNVGSQAKPLVTATAHGIWGRFRSTPATSTSWYAWV